MADRPKPRKKSLTEQVEEVLSDLLSAVDSLFRPPPKLVPIPVRRRR